MKAVTAPEITRKLFGGVFDVDGSGHYPGLELINFIVCCEDGILPGHEQCEQIRLRRRSHSFARRLAANDPELTDSERDKVLLDKHSQQAAADLLKCLELEVPNLAKAKSWERTHFFPYTRSLVHWDARPRRSKSAVEKTTSRFQMERRYLRGGGAFAYSVLRRDPDAARLQAVREGFRLLYPDGTNSALELLAETLLRHGESDESPVFDTLEGDSKILSDRWADLYRDGIRNILRHEALPSVHRVRAVMNWTGIWLVMLESDRAADHVKKAWTGLILDCADTHSQLRRASQKCLTEQIANIEEASRSEAAAGDEPIKNQQISKIRGFFTATASTCGLLNAAKGRRHFTLKLSAIEALVLASNDGREQSFEEFIARWLGERCRLIVGRESAAAAGLLSAFDATIFEENERQLAEQMRATGMLRVYSDATRMIAPEVVQ